jgi:hypothetical protein
MRLLLVLAAEAVRDAPSWRYDEFGGERPVAEQRSLREVGLPPRLSYQPLQPLVMADAPLLQPLPRGKASMDSVIAPEPFSFVEQSRFNSHFEGHADGRDKAMAQMDPDYDKDQAAGLTNTDQLADPEMEGGAPRDHYHVCAKEGEQCHCAKGSVRFGERGVRLDRWTMPVKLGEESKGLTCNFEELKKYRVWKPSQQGNAEPQGCECLKRSIKIKLNMGHTNADGSAYSLLENTVNETQRMQVRERMTKIHLQCLVPEDHAWVDPEATDSLAQINDDSLVEEFSAKNTAGGDPPTGFRGLAVRDCIDDEVEEFVFLKSTGQLRHEKSQLCITADFPDVYNMPRVILKPCSLLESQVVVQRWDVPAIIFKFMNIAIYLPQFEAGVERT